MAIYKRITLAALAVALVVWLVASAVVARKLTRRSRPPFAEPAASVHWSQAEEHRLTTTDGQIIGAWLVRHPDPRGCVLVLHGKGSSRSARLSVMELVWSHDRHARLEDVQAVFSQVEDHAKLVVFPGAEHVSLYKYDPELYSEALLDCLSGDVLPVRY